jgi:hypothetical protein
MKKLFVLFVSLLVITSTYAQTLDKDISKQIRKKAIKEARKETRRLQKDGWKVFPGSLPMSKILEDSWMKILTTDETGNKLYLFADGEAVAQNRSAGEMQAYELAKLQLAGIIESNISALVSANIANTPLNREDAVSITEVVQSSKNLIALELGLIDPAFKIYREVGNKNIEVNIRIFYDTKQQVQIAKKIIRNELKDKLKINEETLNTLMGLPKTK